MTHPRADNQIINQTEQIAAVIAEGYGFALEPGQTFHTSRSPRAQGHLRIAYKIQGLLTDTDVSSAVANVENDLFAAKQDAEQKLAQAQQELASLRAEVERLRTLEDQLRDADAVNGQLNRQLQDARRIIDQLTVKLGDQVVFRGDAYKVYAIGDKAGTFDIQPLDGKSGDSWRNVPPSELGKVVTV